MDEEIDKTSCPKVQITFSCTLLLTEELVNTIGIINKEATVGEKEK